MPGGLTATIVSPTQVRLTWDAVDDADSYDVRRDATTIGSPTTNAFDDNAAGAAAVQLYTVRAVGPGGTSAWSGAALAQTSTFTDVTLIPRLTPVRTTHVLQLRDAINALRTAALLSPATFTDASLSAVRVKTTHVNELRSSLDGARSTLGLAPLTYTHSLAANATPVRAVDLTELRTGVTGHAAEGLFWNSVVVPSAAESMACSATRIFSGAPGLVRRSTDGGVTWSGSSGLPAGESVTAIASGGDGYVFAQTADGAFHRSTDHGANWTEVAASTPETFTLLLGAPNGLFAVGGACASVWFSTDGAVWNARNSGISGCVTSLARSSRKRLYAGTAASGVFLSTNEGTSWSPAGPGIPATNIHALAVDREQRAFAATHDSGVYRSTDDGANWSAANSGLAFTDVASLTVDSTGALVAGSESGARAQTSADGGASWTAASRGLVSAGTVASLCSTHRHRFASIEGKLFRASSGFRLHGLNFSPVKDGQNFDTQIAESQLLERMRVLLPYTQWIRNFRLSKGVQHTARMARTLGLKTAAGAKITNNLQENDAEIAALIDIGKSGDADVLVVGNEVLLAHPSMAGTLVTYIDKVKAEVDLPVTTVETFNLLLAYPAVLDAVEIVFANYYPYWSGIPIDDAIAFLDRNHQEVRTKSGGKQVLVSEAGWPSAGSATATSANAAQHFREFVSWARATNTEYLYFAGFDEQWKNEGGVGPHWGIWNSDATLKSFAEPVLAGEWDGDEVLAGPGTPSITFTSVPPYGTESTLRGQIQHVIPNDHRVAVYIRVGNWWMKPFQLQPLTWIRADGTWGCDVVTHPNDLNATEIAAYLLPAWYTPPDVLNQPVIPPDIVSNAVASVQVARSP